MTARRVVHKLATSQHRTFVGSSNVQKWLYAALGVSGGAVVVVVARQQIVDPESAGRRIAGHIQEKASTSGRAAVQWIQSTLHSVQAPPAPPPPAPEPAVPKFLQGRTLQSYAARWLADWCEQPERSQVAVALGGAPLLDWLLDTATGSEHGSSSSTSSSIKGVQVDGDGGGWQQQQQLLPGEAQSDLMEQQQAERALAFLLQSNATAVLLVERPGAVPRMLRHCLSAAAQQMAAAGQPQETDSGRAAAAAAADPERNKLLAALKQRALEGLINAPQLPGPHITDEHLHHDNLHEAAKAGTDDAQEETSITSALVDWLLGTRSSSSSSSSSSNNNDNSSNIGGGVSISSSAGAATPHAWGGHGEVAMSDLEEMINMMEAGMLETQAASVPRPPPLPMPPPVVSEAGEIVQSLRAAEVPLPELAAARQLTPPAGLPGSVKDGAAEGPLELQDISAVDAATGAGGSSTTGPDRHVQALAAAWLAAWAEAHEANRAKLIGLNLAGTLARVAAEATTGSGAGAGGSSSSSHEARLLQLQIVRAIAALAQGRATPPPDDMTAASPAPKYSAPPPAQHHLAGCLQPLLFVAADAAAEGDAERSSAALRAVRAVLAQGGMPAATAAMSQPVQPLLQQMSLDDDPQVRSDVACAVGALAHAAVAAGDMHTAAEYAQTWRSWLLSTLCAEGGPQLHHVRHSCSVALAELAALPGLPGLQVTHFWLASLLASLAARVWPYNAMVYMGPQDGNPALQEPAAGSPGSAAGDTTASKGGGQVAQGGPGGAKAALDLVDAVPVLPSRIAAVAAALEEASAAVVEEHEPPPYFDPSASGAPAARALHRQVAHAVDMLVAERRVCEALEVLNALVSADPAKQQWLLSVGVLPLLHRLCNPIPGDQHELSPAAATAAAAAAAHRLSAPPAAAPGIAQPSSEPHSTATTGMLHDASGDSGIDANVEVATEHPATAARSYWSWLTWKRAQPVGDAAASAAASSSAQAGSTSGQQTPHKDLVEEESGPPHPDVYTDHEGSSHLCLRRQVARLLSLLAIQPGARPEVGSRQWHAWLQDAAAADDCRLASYATKALLNLEALRPRRAGILRLHRDPHHNRITFTHQPGDAEDEHRGLLSSHHHRYGTPAVAPVYLDMIHLLDPGAPHLWALAKHGRRPDAERMLALGTAHGTPPSSSRSSSSSPAAAQPTVGTAAAGVTAAGSGSSSSSSTATQATSFACQDQHSSSSSTVISHDSISSTSSGLLGHLTDSLSHTVSLGICAITALPQVVGAYNPFGALTISAGGAACNNHLAGAAVVRAAADSSDAPGMYKQVNQGDGSYVRLQAGTGTSNVHGPAAEPSTGGSASTDNLADSSADSCSGAGSSAGSQSSRGDNSSGSGSSNLSASSFSSTVPSSSSGSSSNSNSSSHSTATDNSNPSTADSTRTWGQWWWSWVSSAPPNPAPPPQPVANTVPAAPHTIPTNAIADSTLAADSSSNNNSNNNTRPGAAGPQNTASIMVLTGQTNDDSPAAAPHKANAAFNDANHHSSNGSATLSTAPAPRPQEGLREDEEPLIDVVFIHGIRGGPFITWRKPGAQVKGRGAKARSAAYLRQSHCWPTDWLARDVPRARLLTVEYLAPVSGWEGESLPLEDTVERVMGQLVAAGVGTRPVVFVAHSMGGLLVKEVLVRAMKEAHVPVVVGAAPSANNQASNMPSASQQAVPDSSYPVQAAAGDPQSETAASSGATNSVTSSNAQPAIGGMWDTSGSSSTPAAAAHAHEVAPRQPQPQSTHQLAAAAAAAHSQRDGPHACLARATRGIVFFATPHFGSEMAAMGWKLRHMPYNYAAPAPALAKLTPGPHLVEMNNALAALVASHGVRVTSFLEGAATQLAPVLPKILIVPPASAYPGFGDKLLLTSDDHISLCKPRDKDAASYKIVLGMVEEVMAEALQQRSHQVQQQKSEHFEQEQASLTAA